MEDAFGWILAAAGLVPFWFAAQALRQGTVRVGDQVSKTTYHRATSPGAFWFGVGFYVALGVATIVLGVLAGLGELG